MESKLPRAVLGVLVGVAFGVGGAIFQTTLRNPLASPDIIGVSLGRERGGGVRDRQPRPGRRPRSRSPRSSVRVRRRRAWSGSWPGSGGGYRLVLVGVGVAAALQSVIQYLFTRADVYDAQLALRWLTGSVSARRLADDPACWRWLLLVLLPLVVWLARSLRDHRARRRRRGRARRHRRGVPTCCCCSPCC